MRRFAIIMLVLFSGFILFLFFNGPNEKQAETPKLPDYPTKIATIGGEKFTILQTRTEKERRLGLGAVPKLPKNYGMSFTANGSMGIWMKGMKYPIDILWLDKENTVVHIVHDAEVSSYPKTTFYNPRETDARMVIEINSGEAKRLGVENGSKITLD